jgi:L-ascorbate metabolism protein UlaG (beta-lactamase superfamily)
MRVARALQRVLLAACALLLLAGLAVVIEGWRAFGQRAAGTRLARMQRSPQWRGDHFVNPEPLVNDWLDSLTGWLHASAYARPREPLEIPRVEPQRFATPPASGLRVTWLGHSSTLIELDGARILTDPIWSERASPLRWLGPKRWYPPRIALRDLPAVDAVVISHDHYDHLDYATIVALKDWKTKFIVPLGVGADLAYWGVPERNIIELDWWQRAYVATLEIVCTPARHASGRTLFDKDTKLWAGYAFVGAAHRVFFSGDTGLFTALKVIGARLGPFDLTLIEIGQYNRAWPDWHIGPEQAVTAARWLRGRALLPVHWGLLTLAYHGWTEPIERTLTEAKRVVVPVMAPKPGESFQPSEHPSFERWWPSLPWRTAAQDPIRSSQVR